MINIECIIPVKGTSERIKEKNTRLINGKRLFIYTAEVALKSGFDKVIISTESKSILASVPTGVHKFQREIKYATATSTVFEVCRDYLQRQPILPESFCVLLPTSPLRASSDIRRAKRQFKGDCLMSVSECDPPQHTLLIKDNMVMSYKNVGDIRQSAKYYKHDGYLIMCNTEAFFNSTDFYDMHVIPWHTPPERSLDINTMDDLLLARLKMEGQNES